jgi:hypothetical protein
MEVTLQAFNRILSFAGIRFYANNNGKSHPWCLFQIFNFIIGLLCLISTTAFLVLNYEALEVFIEAACIWTTGVVMTISLGICLIFRSRFREFLNEMVFKDKIMEMPLIMYIVGENQGPVSMQLKALVEKSQGSLFRFTRILLYCYVMSIWLVVTLYLCGPIHKMRVTRDSSLRILGK